MYQIRSSEGGSSLLHEAVREVRNDADIESYSSRSLDIVVELLRAGAQVNAKNSSAETPLLIAFDGLLLSDDPNMFRIHEKLISTLRDYGAVVDVDAAAVENTPRVRVVPARRRRTDSEHIRDANLILGATAYFGESKTPRLVEAVVAGDPDAVLAALESGEDPSAKIIPSKTTVLHFATWLGHSEVVELLLGMGRVKPNSADHFGLTPLLIAAAMGNESCLEALLKAGARHSQRVVGPALFRVQSPSTRVDFLINMPRPICQGTSPLHEAVKSNNPRCVELLIQHGANVEAKDSLGNTPLLVAGAALKRDLRLNVVTQQASPSYSSSYARKPSVVSYTSITSTENIQYGFSEANGPSTSQEQVRCATDVVAKYERITSILIKLTKDVNILSDVSVSALMNAVSLGSVMVSQMLLDKDADPSLKNKYGDTPVHEAASKGCVELLKRFVDHVATKHGNRERTLAVINSKDGNGSTPVHRAAYCGNRACVSYLIGAGADLSLQNIHGLSALEAILLHVYRSRSYLSSLLDSRLTCKRAHKWEGDFVLELDFSFLLPEGGARQTVVMNTLLASTVLPKNTQRDILEHPLVEAFYRLKWQKAKRSFYAVITVHLIFVISLSAFVSLEYIDVSNEGTLRSSAGILRYVHLFFAVLVLANAVGPCFLHFHYYIRKFETWILVTSALLSIFWALARLDVAPSFLVVVSSSDLGKFLLSFILPLAWAALMLMVGRFRDWGARALLFGVVLRNVLVTSVVLGLLVLGLSLSFFVLFHDTRPNEFGDPWKSFVNTIVMMTGEYNYSETFEGSNFYDRLLFLIFVVVATLVIMNLVIGLAVTDAQSLSTVGEWLCLKKKMEFANVLESIVPRMVARCCLPRRMKFMVDGSEDSGYIIKNRALPSRLVDALMDSALRYQAEKPSLNKAAGDVVITFPETEDCSIELHIIDAEEGRVNDILRALYRRVGGSIKEFVESSKSLPNLGSKVFWVKRVIRKFRDK
ncbi:transient receptor potential channel pyrexia-like [Ischnura elegans]|uniref:transient receptor potential channel pyrexia-like n=1 Tax=Ischnura elegans TaxID=197161 RepID=UPI001ED8AF30|nr:transient receptor potential channel pyrexia-like [Ischnura elegans]